jgi:hypothetical protein
MSGSELEELEELLLELLLSGSLLLEPGLAGWLVSPG